MTKTKKPRAKQPVALTISLSRSKPSARVSAAAGSVCTLNVAARRAHETFPPFRIGRHGRGAVAWTVPANAPRGKWTFSIRCRKSRRTHSASATAFILTTGSGGGLAAPDSVQLVAGATLGGKGGGVSPCAPVQTGGQHCFPSDPYNFYADQYVAADIGQCTWYAVGRRPDLGGKTTHNAYQFLSDAQAHGVPTGTVAVAGAIAVNKTYRDKSGHLLGHVACVDSVSSDGKTLVVDEANVVPLTITINVHVPASEFQGYVYGGPAGNGPGSTTTGNGPGTAPTNTGGSQDLWFIKTKNTGSGHVEVHSATAASGYQSGQHSVTWFSPGDADNGWFQMAGSKG